MPKELNLQRLVFLYENRLNPSCHKCKKELSGFLISQKELVEFFSPIDIGWLVQKKLIQRSENYKPKLIIYLCRYCIKENKNDKNNY